jgi:hypothetical protein
MPRPAWIALAVLTLAEVVVSTYAAGRAHDRTVTYVFTPLVDVVPGGVPLSAGEATELAAEARDQVDARDIQKAYARMGSTISLDDLLRGVESLADSDAPLTADQRKRVTTVLEDAQAKHAAVIAVQEEILDDEAEIGREVEELLAALPADARARVEARSESKGDGKPPRPGQPGQPGPFGQPGQPGQPPPGSPPTGGPPAGGASPGLAPGTAPAPVAAPAIVAPGTPASGHP